MHHVRLTRVTSTHDRLRTDEVEGQCIGLPVIGRDFILIGKPLVEGYAFRFIQTTPVKSLKLENGSMIFTTDNSTYKLEVLNGEG